MLISLKFEGRTDGHAKSISELPSIFILIIFILTKKSVTTYPAGYLNFPQTLVSCVRKSTDGPYACSDCPDNACSFSLYNSLTGIVIQTACNSSNSGNKPQITSCYNGTLTASFQQIAECSTPSVYCQVLNDLISIHLKRE